MNYKGFTLIEALIASVILAIGMLGIAGMQIASLKGNIFSSSLTQATFLAQDKLEYLKYLSYNDSDLSSGQHDEGTIPGTFFLRQYHIVEDTGNSVKTITITVQWADRGNHKLVLTTIRTK